MSHCDTNIIVAILWKLIGIFPLSGEWFSTIGQGEDTLSNGLFAIRLFLVWFVIDQILENNRLFDASKGYEKHITDENHLKDTYRNLHGLFIIASTTGAISEVTE